MKWNGTLTSIVIHAAVGLILVFVVKGHNSGTISRFFTFFRPPSATEAKKAASAARGKKKVANKKKAKPAKTKTRRAGRSKRTRSARRTRSAVDRGADAAAKSAAKGTVHDFGLVVDGNGTVPANAVVLDAPGGRDGALAAGAHSAAKARAEAEARARAQALANKQQRRAAVCRQAIVAATPASREPIQYPMASRISGVQGNLVLRLRIDKHGRVRAVRVVSAVDPQLDRHVASSVRGWRFNPGRRCGRAVASTYTISLRFELSGA